jgi:hypothetical protein
MACFIHYSKFNVNRRRKDAMEQESATAVGVSYAFGNHRQRLQRNGTKD